MGKKRAKRTVVERDGDGAAVSFNTVVGCDTLNHDVMYHFGDAASLRRRLDELQLDPQAEDEAMRVVHGGEGAGCGHTVDMGDNSGVLVYCLEIPMDAAGLALLAHETLHAAFMVARKIGAEFTPEGEEFYAYLVQHLTRRVLEELAGAGLATCP